MSERATVTVRDNQDAHRFEAVDESGTVAGFSEYKRHDDRVVFLHTEVADEFEGRGVGSTLARGALDAVRGEGKRVVAICPFIKAFLGKHPEYADLT